MTPAGTVSATKQARLFTNSSRLPYIPVGAEIDSSTGKLTGGRTGILTRGIANIAMDSNARVQTAGAAERLRGMTLIERVDQEGKSRYQLSDITGYDATVVRAPTGELSYEIGHVQASTPLQPVPDRPGVFTRQGERLLADTHIAKATHQQVADLEAGKLPPPTPTPDLEPVPVTILGRNAEGFVTGLNQPVSLQHGGLLSNQISILGDWRATHLINLTLPGQQDFIPIASELDTATGQLTGGYVGLVANGIPTIELDKDVRLMTPGVTKMVQQITPIYKVDQGATNRLAARERYVLGSPISFNATLVSQPEGFGDGPRTQARPISTAICGSRSRCACRGRRARERARLAERGKSGLRSPRRNPDGSRRKG